MLLNLFCFKNKRKGRVLNNRGHGPWFPFAILPSNKNKTIYIKNNCLCQINSQHFLEICNYSWWLRFKVKKIISITYLEQNEEVNIFYQRNETNCTPFKKKRIGPIRSGPVLIHNFFLLHSWNIICVISRPKSSEDGTVDNNNKQYRLTLKLEINDKRLRLQPFILHYSRFSEFKKIVQVLCDTSFSFKHGVTFICVQN